ncbi:MAG: hypothetical protein Q8P36_02120 [bacterium]|nr:hypothetical protein [bacterium]
MRMFGYSAWNGEKKRPSRQPLFAAECLPPPPGKTWSTANDIQMLQVMRERDIKRAFVPHAAFNGLVGVPKGPWIVHQLDRERQLLGSPDDEPLEGYEMLPDEVMLSTTGGCMFIVAVGHLPGGRMRMIFSHAGRDSLIDRGRIAGRPARRYEGVLYAIAQMFEKLGIEPNHIEVHGLFPISPSVFVHPFSHPEWSSFNRTMLKDIQARWGATAAYEVDGTKWGGRGVAIDLSAILRAQADELHFFAAKGYPYLTPGGPYVTTRDRDPIMAHKRNLAILRRLR